MGDIKNKFTTTTEAGVTTKSNEDTLNYDEKTIPLINKKTNNAPKDPKIGMIYTYTATSENKNDKDELNVKFIDVLQENIIYVVGTLKVDGVLTNPVSTTPLSWIATVARKKTVTVTFDVEIIS